MTYACEKDFLTEKLGPALSGNGKRLHSGEGPFRLQFKSAEQGSYTRALRRTGGHLFMEIDGEYFAVSKPNRVEVTWNAHVHILKRHHKDTAMLESLRESMR